MPGLAELRKLLEEVQGVGSEFANAVGEKLTPATLEEKLQVVKDAVYENLSDAQKDKVDEWINLANEVHEKKKEAQNNTGFGKEAAEEAYNKAREKFKVAIDAAIADEENDPDLAEIAKIIKKKSKNHENFDDVQENLKSMFSLDKDEPFHKMTDGELLGEIIFRLLMLIFAGLMTGKYLASEKLHESDVEKLLRKANNTPDPAKQSMIIGQAAQIASENIVRVMSQSQAPADTLSSSSSASTPSSTSTPLFNVVPPESQPTPGRKIVAEDKESISNPTPSGKLKKRSSPP